LLYYIFVIDQVDCFGDDCYALAFGIPAVLMVVAIGKLIQVYNDKDRMNKKFH